MTDDLTRRLAALDSCAVSDAMDREGVPAAILGLKRLSTDRRIAGRAVTVLLGAADGRASHRHLCTAAIEAAGPGSVIVIAHQGRLDVAGWGGVLSCAASTRGVEGVVIDGACRDIDESREMDLPVYGRRAVPVTARGRIVEYDWDVPVTLAGVEIAPGDYILADGSGVVAIPQARAADVIAAAERIVAKEQLMASDVRSGKPVSEVMGTDYEKMLEQGSM